MSHRIIALGILLALSGPVVAQKMSEKAHCLQSVRDAKVNLTKTEDTGRPGAKVEAEAQTLFPIAIRLCEAGNYEDASKLVAYLRHLLAD